MKAHEIKKSAEEFGISIESAVRMRVRYLLGVIDAWFAYIDEETDVMPSLTVMDALDEVIDLRRYEARYKKRHKGGITDEMIAQAREYPVSQLIEFERCKALAWCHPDKTPSLSHWQKGNMARCFVCDQSYGPIDICIERDGMSFIDAVKYLCGRG